MFILIWFGNKWKFCSNEICTLACEQQLYDESKATIKCLDPGSFLHSVHLSKGRLGCIRTTRKPSEHTAMQKHTQKHIQKLLTLLQLINFALQSSLRTIRIPWRNDFPIKGDLGEDSLFISDSRSSLFQSFKLELIFQFSHWLLWTCSRGGQIELRSEIFVPHKVTVASNTLMCFARHRRRQQIFSSACWWRESPSRVATSLTLQSTGLVPVGFFFSGRVRLDLFFL